MQNLESLNVKAEKAGIWYTCANILLKGCIFFTLPIFTRLLSIDDFGVYNSYIAYEQIIQAVLGLGLYGTVKNAMLDFKEKINEYLSAVLSLSLLALIICLIIANSLHYWLTNITGFNQYILNCLILQSYGAYLIYFYGVRLSIEFRYKSYIVISCFNTITSVVASILLIIYVFPKERYLGRILGSALPLTIIAVTLSIKILYTGRVVYKKEYWEYALTIGIPLIPHVLSQSLLSQFDRIMIKSMIGNSEAGIYSYIYTVCTITSVICTSLDNAWTPWTFIKIKDNFEEDVKKAGLYYVLLFATITLGFICVMPELTMLIADSSYWPGIDLLIPLSLTNYFIFLYTLPVGVEYYYKKTIYISIGTIFAAITNICLNYFVLKLIGYKAAAYTTLISYIALFCFHCLLSRKFGFLKLYELKKIVIISIVLIMISALIHIFFSIGIIGAIIRYSMIFLILFMLFYKRTAILKIYRERS